MKDTPPPTGSSADVYWRHLNVGAQPVTLILWLTLLLGGSVSMPAAAEATVIECQDEDGEVSYRDRCPPGSRQIGSLALGGRRAADPVVGLQELARTSPVTLFRVAECDTCDLIRLVLNDRGVPFSEVDVERNPEAQSQLKAVSGTSRVPTVTVGKEVIAGFDRVLLQQKLDLVGYPKTLAPAARE